MKNKSLVLILSLLMVISGVSGSVFAAGFPDMPAEDYWSRPALEKAVANKLLEGFDDGEIKPKAKLTRAQMAIVINRAFGAENKASLEKYVDVKSGDWFYADMEKAVAMKTFNGDENKLNPKENITREDAFLVIARALDLENTAGKPEGFSDLDQIGSWAKEAVYAMVEAGYVQGDGNKLNPKGHISREEFAEVMNNIIADYNPGDDKEIAGNAMIREAGRTLKNTSIEGDLIVGDGVGEGDLTLDNVTVGGRLLVRGGGVDSIIIKGKSDIKNITTSKVRGAVRIAVDAEAQAGDLRVAGENVIVEGKFNDINIVAEKIVVDARDASLKNVRIEGHESKLIVGEDSTVEKLVLEGKMTEADISGKVEDFVVDKTAETPKINIKKAGEVAKMEVNTKATIEGEGKVKEVKANANDIQVNTEGTKVAAGEGTTGVKAGDKPVEAGKEVEVTPPSTGGGGAPTKTAIDLFNEKAVNYNEITLKKQDGEGKVVVATIDYESSNFTATVTPTPGEEITLENLEQFMGGGSEFFSKTLKELGVKEVMIGGETYSVVPGEDGFNPKGILDAFVTEYTNDPNGTVKYKAKIENSGGAFTQEFTVTIENGE